MPDQMVVGQPRRSSPGERVQMDPAARVGRLELLYGVGLPRSAMPPTRVWITGSAL